MLQKTINKICNRMVISRLCLSNITDTCISTITTTRLLITTTRLLITTTRLLITTTRLLITTTRLLITTTRLLITTTRLLITTTRLLITTTRLLITTSYHDIRRYSLTKYDKKRCYKNLKYVMYHKLAGWTT